jgi:hypothetical protein
MGTRVLPPWGVVRSGLGVTLKDPGVGSARKRSLSHGKKNRDLAREREKRLLGFVVIPLAPVPNLRSGEQ